MLIGILHIGKFFFKVPFFKKLLLRNHLVDFVEICNVCARKAIIKAAKRIIILIRCAVVIVILILASLFLEHSVDRLGKRSSSAN